MHGHRAAASDIGVAVALLRAGAEGAKMNVDINIGSLSDAAYAEEVRAETARLADATVRAIEEVGRVLRGA
jgi:formiminotetrahydrofolate cyclodeaminase